jgi:hypothetical protein
MDGFHGEKPKEAESSKRKTLSLLRLSYTKR